MKNLNFICIILLITSVLWGQEKRVEILNLNDKGRYLVINDEGLTLDTISRVNVNMVIVDFSFFKDGSLGLIWKTPFGPIFYKRWQRNDKGVLFFNEQIGYEEQFLKPGTKYVKESFRITDIDSIEKIMEFDDGKLEKVILSVKSEFNFVPQSRLIYNSNKFD